MGFIFGKSKAQDCLIWLNIFKMVVERQSYQFSVVIPLYNKEGTIVRTLNGVAEQEFKDFEVIIVDDGSTDNGVKLALSYSARFPLRVLSQENAGVSAARNRGVAEARGLYVAFIDADDYWQPSHLTDLNLVLKKFSGAKVISTQIERIIDGEIRIPWGSHGISSFDIYDKFMRDEPINSSSLAIDRQFFIECGGYNSRSHFFEDVELYFRMAERIGRFYANYSVSAYYFKDDIRSATASKKYGYKDYAHWKFLEDRLARGIATRSMRACARRIFGAVVYGLAWRFKENEIRNLCALYPNMAKCVVLSPLLCNRITCALVWPFVFAVRLVQKVKMWVSVLGMSTQKIQISEGKK